jgi:PBSX family phage terminase large subunit
MAKKVALFASPFDTSPLVLAGQSVILAKQQIVSPVRPPSPFQQRIIDCDSDLALVGGRGGGKSFGVALRIANRVNRYKRQYRGLYLRKTYEGLEDFEEVCQDVFRLHCPGSYNISKKAWRFDNGGFLKFGQLELDKHYRKYIGKSFMELYIDEAGQFADPVLLDRLLSNIRGPKGVPFSRTILSNPGDVGHWWIYNRYIKDKEIGVAYQDPDCDRTVVTLQSTYRDNPHQNNEEYQSMLLSSTANDEELRRAYIDGDWRISRGSFFATVLDEARSKIQPWASVPNEWKKFLGMDYGQQHHARSIWRQLVLVQQLVINIIRKIQSYYWTNCIWAMGSTRG